MNKILTSDNWKDMYWKKKKIYDDFKVDMELLYDELLCKRFNINHIQDMECIICMTNIAPRYKVMGNKRLHPIGCCNAIICTNCAYKNYTNKCFHCRQENRWNPFSSIHQLFPLETITINPSTILDNIYRLIEESGIDISILPPFDKEDPPLNILQILVSIAGGFDNVISRIVD